MMGLKEVASVMHNGGGGSGDISCLNKPSKTHLVCGRANNQECTNPPRLTWCVVELIIKSIQTLQDSPGVW